MILAFHKYHGAGNDFIIVDDRSLAMPTDDPELIAWLCHRRFGIGADGLILFRNSEEADFEMVYFNADGHMGSMCGNGGRCIVHWAREQSLIQKECKFKAYDGIHRAQLLEEDYVSLEMFSLGELKATASDFEIDTGSPHYIKIVEGLEDFDVFKEGQTIRYNETYTENGINVNFIEDMGEQIFMRTYERGVEDETLACGTGTVAVAIMAKQTLSPWKEKDSIPIKALGGDLEVTFKDHSIFLSGPAIMVCKGEIEI